MALKKCKECGHSVSNKAASCPSCGAVLKKKTGCGTWVVFGFLLLLVIGIIGSQSSDTTSYTPSSSKNSTSQKQPSKPKLEIVSYEWARGEYGNRYIKGVVKNNSSKQYGYVQIEINLYDKSDAQVGSTMANINNLEPGSTWKFEAIVMEDTATTAKVKDVTGF